MELKKERMNIYTFSIDLHYMTFAKKLKYDYRKRKVKGSLMVFRSENYTSPSWVNIEKSVNFCFVH